MGHASSICSEQRFSVVARVLWQEEEAAGEERARRWVRVKASLLRDQSGQFKIVVREDGGGVYVDALHPTGVTDDREKIQPGDYLASIARRPIEEMSLAQVKANLNPNHDPNPNPKRRVGQ